MVQLCHLPRAQFEYKGHFHHIAIPIIMMTQSWDCLISIIRIHTPVRLQFCLETGLDYFEFETIEFWQGHVIIVMGNSSLTLLPISNLSIVYWLTIQKYQQQQPQTQFTQTMEHHSVNTVHFRCITVNVLQNLTKDTPYVACNVEVRGAICEFKFWTKWSCSPCWIVFNIDFIPLRCIESL